MELMDSKYKSPIPAEFHWIKKGEIELALMKE
jgi:hypothetical protein